MNHIANILFLTAPTWHPSAPLAPNENILDTNDDLESITQYASDHIDTTMSWGPGLGDAIMLRNNTLVAP